MGFKTRRALHDPSIENWQALPATPRQRGRIIELGDRKKALELELTQGDAEFFIANREPPDAGDIEALECFGVRDFSKLNRYAARSHVKALMSLPKYAQLWDRFQLRKAEELAARLIEEAGPAAPFEDHLGIKLAILLYLARCDGGLRGVEMQAIVDYAMQEAGHVHHFISDDGELAGRLERVVVTHDMFLELLETLQSASFDEKSRLLDAAIQLVLADRKIHRREYEGLQEISNKWNLPLPDKLQFEPAENDANIRIRLIELRVAEIY